MVAGQFHRPGGIVGTPLLAVAALAPGGEVEAALDRNTGTSVSRERSCVVAEGLEAEAGLPFWSGEQGVSLLGFVKVSDNPNRSRVLLLRRIDRSYARPKERGRRIEEEQMKRNAQSLVLALLMCEADRSDGFPPIRNGRELQETLQDYVGDPSLFRPPGAQEPLTVEYLVKPGTKLGRSRTGKRAPAVSGLPRRRFPRHWLCGRTCGGGGRIGGIAGHRNFPRVGEVSISK